jgi:glycosyltransferase involved in cell wall biosynthesis
MASLVVQAYRAVVFCIEAVITLPLLLLCLASRFAPRPIDIGLGPECLVNNIYHKRALNQHGYSAETFVAVDNFISSAYDVNLAAWSRNPLFQVWIPYYFFLRVLFRYKALFIYFNGGPLHAKPLFRQLEPTFYKLAGVKVVVMPFGSDVQVMPRSRNLVFKHGMSIDYPGVAKDHRRIARQIDRWSRHASWVISGCEWVDYMYVWDTLMSGHFSIDMERWKPTRAPRPAGPFRVLHAPNHPAIKGTVALQTAVAELQAEGLEIELVVLRGVPNTQIQQTIEQVDLVADQFVMGWYALFAIEAMALEKPVLCYLRPDFLALYEQAGVVRAAEIPLLNTSVTQIAERLRWCLHHREELAEIGRAGRPFVAAHHSTGAVGKVFAEILAGLGLAPSLPLSLSPSVASS